MPRPIYDDDARTPILRDTSDTENYESDQQRHPSVVLDNELQENLTGCGASACCNPSHGVYRFNALILMCLVGFGKSTPSLILICLYFPVISSAGKEIRI